MVAVFIFIFLASLVFTVISIPIARLFGFLDLPGSLKIHASGIPRFGGFGILCGVTVGCATFRLPESIFLVGGGLAWLVGAIDDRWNVSPLMKLTGLTLAGCLLSYVVVDGRGSFLTLLYGILALIFVIGLANAVNLIDGMDGLAAGNASIIFGALSLMAALHHLDFRFLLVISVANLGFLPLNFPVAKTFMGDSGSLFVGYLLAVSLILLMQEQITLFLGGLIISILPVFDTLLGIIRRIVNGSPLFRGDRGHFYDRLDERIGNRTRTVLVTYVFTITCGFLGIAASFLPGVIAAMIVTFLALSLLLISYQLGWLYTSVV